MTRSADDFCGGNFPRPAHGVKAGEQFLAAQSEPPLSLMQRHLRLKNAVVKIYMAAHWSPDRPVTPDAEALWTELRDAAEIVPGNSPQPRAECCGDSSDCNRGQCPKAGA